MGSSGARFTISGTASTPRGFVAEASQVLSLALEQNPSVDVTSCVYFVVASSTANGTPAPAPVFSNQGVAYPVNGAVSMTLPDAPGSGAYGWSWIVRCQTNGGVAVPQPDGTQNFTVNTFDRIVAVPTPSTGLRLLVPGESVEFSSNAWVESVNDLMLQIEDDSVAGGTELVLAGSLVSGQGAGGGPGGYRVVLPSTDFPGTSSARLKATIFAAQGSGSAPAWETDTVYSSTSSPPSIVVANGTIWICTTGGTSAATGMGPSAEGPHVGDGSCFWRAAKVTLTAYLYTSSGVTVLATLSAGYQFGAAVGNGSETMNVSADVSAALFALQSAGTVVIGIAGDPADTSGNYTMGECSYCAIEFS